MRQQGSGSTPERPVALARKRLEESRAVNPQIQARRPSVVQLVGERDKRSFGRHLGDMGYVALLPLPPRGLGVRPCVGTGLDDRPDRGAERPLDLGS
jgi:hypothetical protein